MRKRGDIAVEGAGWGETQPKPHMSATMGLLMVRSLLRAIRRLRSGRHTLDEELRKVAADGTDEVGWRCRRE